MTGPGGPAGVCQGDLSDPCQGVAAWSGAAECHSGTVHPVIADFLAVWGHDLEAGRQEAEEYAREWAFLGGDDPDWAVEALLAHLNA